MKFKVGFFLVASLVILTGCVSTVPRMRAESRADVVGESVVIEETVTTHPDGTTTRVVTTTRKSAPAADIELKGKELEGRTQIGVANANNSCCYNTYGYGGYDRRYYGDGGAGYVQPYVQPYGRIEQGGDKSAVTPYNSPPPPPKP